MIEKNSYKNGYKAHIKELLKPVESYEENRQKWVQDQELRREKEQKLAEKEKVYDYTLSFDKILISKIHIDTGRNERIGAKTAKDYHKAGQSIPKISKKCDKQITFCKR